MPSRERDQANGQGTESESRQLLREVIEALVLSRRTLDETRPHLAELVALEKEKKALAAKQVALLNNQNRAHQEDQRWLRKLTLEAIGCAKSVVGSKPFLVFASALGPIIAAWIAGLLRVPPGMLHQEGPPTPTIQEPAHVPLLPAGDSTLKERSDPSPSRERPGEAGDDATP